MLGVLGGSHPSLEIGVYICRMRIKNPHELEAQNYNMSFKYMKGCKGQMK